GHFGAAKHRHLPDGYLRIVGALRPFINQGAVADVGPHAVPRAHVLISIEESLTAPRQAEYIHEAVRPKHDFPVMPHQSADDEPDQLFDFLALNRNRERAHHKSRWLPRPDACGTLGNLAMQFLILGK